MHRVASSRPLVRLTALVLVALMPAAAAVEVPLLSTVQGNLTLSAPIAFMGAITAHRSFVAEINPVVEGAATDDVATYHAEALDLYLFEEKWKTLGSDPNKNRVSEPTFDPPQILPLTDGKMRVVSVQKGATWLVGAATQDDAVLKSPNSRCLIESGPSQPVLMREGESATASAGSVLHARCSTSMVSVEGIQDVRIEDATVIVEGRNSKGEAQMMELPTGTQHTPMDPTETMWEHTYRYVVALAKAPASFQFAIPSDLHLQAPTLFLQGVTTLPPTQGAMTWGDWTGSDDIPAMDLDGSINLFSSGPQTVALTGATVNKPEFSNARRVVKDTDGVNAGPMVLAAAGGAALLLALLPRAKWLFLGALFTRLSEERAMEHPRRQQIVEAVRTNPGLKVQEVCRMLQLSRGVADHHVDVLVRQGVLVCRRFGRETGLFVKGTIEWNLQPQVQRLRNETVRGLLQHIQSEPAITQTELAARLNVGQSYVCRVLKQLTQLGVLAVAEDGRRRAYEVTPLANNAWLPPSTPMGLVTVEASPVAAPSVAPGFAALTQ